MKPVFTTLILSVFLLGAFAFYSFRADAAQNKLERAAAAKETLIAEQESSVPAPATALKDPEIRPGTRAFNFFVPSEPVHVEGNPAATAANQKVQLYEAKASRFFNHAYKELHKLTEDEAEDEGQVDWLRTTVGAQLDGARRLILSAKANSTAAEWSIMAPRILRWSFAAFDKIQNDWQSKYAWIEEVLKSFREDFTDAAQ